MPLDLREHQEARELYLLTILEKTEADEKAGSTVIPCLEEMEIADRSGLDNPTVDRISQELEAEGADRLSWRHGSVPGHLFAIHRRPRPAEKIRYDKSSLAKRRRGVRPPAGESVKEAAKFGFGKLLSWFAAGAVVTVASWWKWDTIAHWLRHLIGKQ